MNIAFRRALVACMAIVSMAVANVSAQTRNPADFAEGKVINPNNHYQKNGNHVLGLAFDTTACGLNYVGAKKMITSRYNAVAINTFGAGFPATLSISGLPNSCYAVVRAFIWWDVSYFAGSSDTPLLVLTNPFGAIDTIAATDIGSDASKCWGEVGTRTFRADVTNYITGNGAYVLDSIIGSNSFEVDGASLIIIYRDLNAPYTGSISIWDGCISIVGGTVDQVISIDTVCAAATNARAFYMAADLQDNVATTHQATLNSIVGNYTQDFWNFDDTATTVSVGQATSDFGISISSDCYNFLLAGLYYQTTTCTVCTPTGFSFTTHQTPIPCGSVSGATASVTTGGGIGPFSFVWSPSGGTDAAATGLSAGIYHCIITDLGGLCTAIATFDIVQQDVINPHTFHVPISCHDSANGLAYVNPTGGVGPYLYLWTPSGGTSATASSFSAGTYTISVADGNGCFIIDTVSFTDPAPIVVVPSTLDVPCNGGTTGAATATVSGGNGPYNYSWSPSVGLGNSALSITAGTYFVTITDNTGCTATQAFTLTQPPPITIAISNDTTVCPGDAVNLFAIASGGSVPYHYVWSNGVMNSTQTVHPTVTTVYSIIVTDANGCASQTYFDTVTVLPAPVITFSPQNPTICIGDAVTITANGTSNYLWSTGSTNASISVSPT
ncbi:MAG: SprB repeat-containing protein, partial [Bacteroidota bacterium]